MRKVDRSPVRFQKMWDGAVKTIRKVLGITRGSLTDNAGRVILFVTDAQYRLSVMAATANDEKLTEKKCHNLLKKHGLLAPASIVGNPAVQVFDEQHNLLAYVVGVPQTEKAEAEEVASGMVTL